MNIIVILFQETSCMILYLVNNNAKSFSNNNLRDLEFDKLLQEYTLFLIELNVMF